MERSSLDGKNYVSLFLGRLSLLQGSAVRQKERRHDLSALDAVRLLHQPLGIPIEMIRTHCGGGFKGGVQRKQGR